MLNIKGCSGFGDAIYLRSMVEWLLHHRSDQYQVFTRYPQVFEDLNVQPCEYLQNQYQIDYDATYLSRKHITDTTQFEDMCIMAGLPIKIPFTSMLKARDPLSYTLALPLVIPMNGCPKTVEMMPFEEEYMAYLENFPNVLMLRSQFDFLHLVDLFNHASVVICQQGWGNALAQLLDVPCKCVFTERALNSKYEFIKQITPGKVIEKKNLVEAIIMK